MEAKEPPVFFYIILFYLFFCFCLFYGSALNCFLLSLKDCLGVFFENNQNLQEGFLFGGKKRVFEGFWRGILPVWSFELELKFSAYFLVVVLICSKLLFCANPNKMKWPVFPLGSL